MSALSFHPFHPLYPLLRGLVGLLARGLAPHLVITGRSALPRRGPVILASNHLSHIDSALLCSATRRPLWFMAMREIFANRWLGPAARAMGAFPIERGSADRHALGLAMELLQAGQVLVIYPEGQLSKSGELQELLPGAALLALRAGVPVVPVGICGSTAIMPYGMALPRPTLARVGLHFGPALDLTDLEGLASRQARKIAVQRLEAGIRAAKVAAGTGAAGTVAPGTGARTAAGGRHPQRRPGSNSRTRRLHPATTALPDSKGKTAPS